jgi:hypothetical protein
MIEVYFENRIISEKIATFKHESIYISCLPTLKEIATRQGMIVTEVTVNKEQIFA